jgi:hypothetical protein
VNGSQCTGIHQKIVQDWGNEVFNYNLAHHFYETLIILDVPSVLMRFADQNKTKYAVARFEIEDKMNENFKAKFLKDLKGSDIAKEIGEKIEERLYSENIKKIKQAGRKSKRKISEKYSPSSRKKEVLYITEGLCLDENQKIFIIRKNKILFCKLKNIKLNDLVITHNNNLKPIEHINKSIKNGVKLKTTIGDIVCSENHKWFIYDKNKNEFYFEETKNLNKDNHQLVKNYLAFLESFDEIKEIKEEDKIIKVINDKTEEWDITKTNKITIFNIEESKFKMINAVDLKIGNLLCKICLQRRR